MEGDAGLDLCCAHEEDIIIATGRSRQIPAGIAVKIPAGYCGLVRPRSSTFHKRGLLVVPGMIDEGYTGPLFSHVYNPGLDNHWHPRIIKPFERLAQLVIIPFMAIEPQIVANLPKTERGDKGFGSTGV